MCCSLESFWSKVFFWTPSGFRIVAARSAERVNFLDETVAALSQSQAGDSFFGRTVETLPQSCADTVAGNFAPRSAERGDLSADRIPLLKALFYNPSDETTLWEEWVAYLLIFIANLVVESFLPPFGRYDSLSRTAGIIDFPRAEFGFDNDDPQKRVTDIFLETILVPFVENVTPQMHLVKESMLVEPSAVSCEAALSFSIAPSVFPATPSAAGTR